jgi:hypothetical protein
MKLEITETRDWLLVWKISQEPSIFERVTNDSWGALDHEIRKTHVELIVTNPKNHTLLVSNDTAPAGCFILDQKEPEIFEVHTMLLPSCRGRLAIAAGKLAMKFAFSLPGVKKLVSYCPENLPEVYLFARMCGWRKAGMSAVQWVKNGASYPMRLVEATINDLPK